MRERVLLILGAIAAFATRASAAALSLEQKLEILSRCGLRLQPPFTVDDLLRSWDREHFERAGFDSVLTSLAGQEERPPWRNHCINAWHFDSECIEGNGSYLRIAERLKEMAQGSLPIDKIRDSVDVDGGTAWLAWEYRGQDFRINCKINEDWVDPGVFAHFVNVLAKSDPSKVYLYYDLHGQDCVIACVTKAQFTQLKEAGVQFRPLT